VSLQFDRLGQTGGTKMVNRTDRKTDAEINNRNRQNAAVNYITETGTSPSSRLNTKSRFDDLIVSLANAHENRRARQVTEWEKMRQPNFPLSV
jgi:hypothetical protein